MKVVDSYKQLVTDIKVEIDLSLPYTVLLQKIDFQLDDQFQKDDFAKVFPFSKLLRKYEADISGVFSEALVLSQNKQIVTYQPKLVSGGQSSSFTSQIDSEFEALRHEVLNCANSSAQGDNDLDPSRHSVRVCSVGTSFRLVLNVSENFGIDLSSTKQHPNKEFQEDIRSLSRTLMNREEENSQGISEENLAEDQKSEVQDQQDYKHQKSDQNLGDLTRKQSCQNVAQQKLSPTNQSLLNQNKQSRNNKPKQHKSFLEKATDSESNQDQKVGQDEEYIKQQLLLDQARLEQIKNAEKTFKRAFAQIVQGIRLYCWPCFRMPQANNLIPLINTSFLLEQMKQVDEKRDVDFLIGLSMLNGRKFIQAVEQFRKLQSDLLQRGQLTQSQLDLCIQLEILSADALNQHSQLTEKLNAYKRAVDLSLKQMPKHDPSIQNLHMIREEEAQKILMKLQPYLVKILLQNIDSKIEAIKVAVLRSVEYLIDQLGCSLDKSLLQILSSVIHTYPRSNLHFNQQMIQNQQLPIRYGFYQLQFSQNQSNSFLTQQNFENAISTSYMDSILFDQFLEDDLKIKDGLTFQQTFQINLKNLSNHILESFIQLLSSMSSSTLQAIFNDILQKSIFLGNHPYENQLATDLRIYLIKFADKIINICQGDLVISQSFLNNITLVLIPDQRKLQNAILGGAYLQNVNSTNQVEIAKAKKKTSEMISLACQNLWNTCRTKLFNNYSQKGFKITIDWIFDNLISLAEASDNLSQQEQQKLSLVFDLIELLTQSLQQRSSDFLPKQDENMNYRASLNNHKIQTLSGRETRITNSRQGDQGAESNKNAIIKGSNSLSSVIQNKIKPLISLDLYALLNPVLFWLDFSLEKLERLSLFKMIWKTLTKMMQVLPRDQIDIDLITIIFPVLQKVNLFCQQSSPQIEMLQCLLIILIDIKDSLKIHSSTSQIKNKDFLKFLDDFLVTVAKSIPHNLHEEIFGVCELLLELLKENLRDFHIADVIEALCDKYTMRSKAHKRLQSYFIDMVIEQSNIKMKRDSIANMPFTQVTQMNQNQQVMNQPAAQQIIMNQSYQNLNYQEGIENYEYDRESHDYGEEIDYNSDQEQQNINFQVSSSRTQNYQAVPVTNQDVQQSPISSQRLFNMQNQLPSLIHNNQPNEARGNHSQTRNTINQGSITYFDVCIDVSLVKNSLNHSGRDKYKDQVNLEFHFEKLAILIQLIKRLDSNHIAMFSKMINRQDVKDSLVNLFANERKYQIGQEILESFSNFYMSNSAPKNIYEHQSNILHNSANFNDGIFPRPHNNNNQNSQSSNSYHQNFNQPPIIQRESSRTSFVSSQHHNNGLGLNLRNQLSTTQNFVQYSHPLNSNVPHQILRYQNLQNQNNLDDDLMIDNLNIEQIQDEVDIINRERLNLIQLYSILIKLNIERFEQSQDGNIQLSTLNLIDNLLTNLMPVPTFQNQIIKQALQFQRVHQGQQLHPSMNQEIGQGINSSIYNLRQRVHHYEIADLDKLIIIDNPQRYHSLISQQAHIPQNQWQNFILQEFEVTDMKYLHCRFNFTFQIWPFIERSLFQSSWSNVRSIAYGIICQALKVVIPHYKQSFQNRTKHLIYPMLNSLLNSKDTESKAGGLNIIGSFCGLGQDLTNLSYHIKLLEHLNYFRQNSQFVSVALWQQVFSLQEDWDSTIREAATVLIQLCAPRDSVKHFNKISQDRYSLKLQSLIKTHNLLGNQAIRQKLYQGGSESMSNSNSILINPSESVEEYKIAQDALKNVSIERHNIQEQRRSIFRNYLLTNQSMRSGMGSQLGLSSDPGMRLNSQRGFNQDQEDQNSSSSDERVIQDEIQNDHSQDEYFFVDNYNEEQLKSLIVIFKNDYKPPKSLWIEKNGLAASGYNHINASGSEYIDLTNKNQEDQANLVDVFEDKIVDRLNSMYHESHKDDPNGGLITLSGSSVQGESDYLIFERHFESDQEKLAIQNNKSQLTSKLTSQYDPLANLDINQEDLGIIDLDEQEDGFDELDDDKLPVLKNSYSKKNRPNNSKSVAIGSKTQEMRKTQSSQLSDQQKKEQDSLSHMEEAKIVQSQDDLEKNEVQSHQVQIETIKGYKQQKGLKFDSDDDEDTQYEQIDLDRLSESDKSIQKMMIQDQEQIELSSQDQLIDQYEKKIALSIQDLSSQLLQTQSQIPLQNQPKEVQIILNTSEQKGQEFAKADILPLSPRGIMSVPNFKTQKQSEVAVSKQIKPKTNKSFDLRYKKAGGLTSPLKVKEIGKAQNVSSSDQDIELQLKNIAITQPHSNNATQSKQDDQLIYIDLTQIKKFNEIVQPDPKKGVSKQAQRLKNQGKHKSFSYELLLVKQTLTKREFTNLSSRPLLNATTSPGVLNNTTMGKLPSTSQPNTATAKTLSVSQFTSNSTSNDAGRKRKSDFHRKSEVPPYSTLAQKKFATSSSLSQNTSNKNAQSAIISKNANLDTKNHTITKEKDASMELRKIPTQNFNTNNQSQTLMQKAKQVFVSRAKSQSYLNTVNGINNISQNSVQSSINSLNFLKKNDYGSFKLSQNLNNLTSQQIGQHKSFTGSLMPGYKSQSGRRFIKLTSQMCDDVGSSTSMLNSACSGGKLSQVHRGYFSNDEIDKPRSVNKNQNIQELMVNLPMAVNSQIKRKIISPPRSGDLQFRAKNSISSDDEIGKVLLVCDRPSSHNLRSNRSRQPKKLDDFQGSSRMNPLIKSQEKDSSKARHELRPNDRIKKTKRFIKNGSIDSEDDRSLTQNSVVHQQKSIDDANMNDINFYPDQDIDGDEEGSARIANLTNEDAYSNKEMRSKDRMQKIQPKGKYSNTKKGQILVGSSSEIKEQRKIQRAKRREEIKQTDNDSFDQAEELDNTGLLSDDIDEFTSDDEMKFEREERKVLSSTEIQANLQVKQLSCIDEEEDMSERKTFSLLNNNGGNQNLNLTNQFGSNMYEISPNSSIVGSDLKQATIRRKSTGEQNIQSGIDSSQIIQQNIHHQQNRTSE